MDCGANGTIWGGWVRNKRSVDRKPQRASEKGVKGGGGVAGVGRETCQVGNAGW